MISAREVVLTSIRGALEAGGSSVPSGAPAKTGGSRPDIPRRYERSGRRTSKELRDLLHERISDYRATVVRCRAEKLPEVVDGRLASRNVSRLVVPSDLPQPWLDLASRGDRVLLQESVHHSLSYDEISSAHAVLTGCALAIAETGTLVLNGGPMQGRRVLTLLPDYHLCVVFAQQVVETVPEAVEALENAGRRETAPLTLISGPSATSDIELIRVEGVHGPRTLDVILVEDR